MTAAATLGGGLSDVAVTDELSADLLVPLLAELRSEPCAHSWQPHLAKVAEGEMFDTLRQILANGRPGRLFTYYRTAGGRPQALAVATASDRVARDFPFDGIPVLARAFVRRDSRGRGLHRAMLRHRLDYCRMRWGDRLLAVHIGTASASVERNLRRIHGGVVACLGNEDLGEAGQVRALLAVTGNFLDQLQRAVPDRLGAAQAAVLDFLHHGPERRRAAEVADDLAALAAEHSGFRALQAFIHALPHLC